MYWSRSCHVLMCACRPFRENLCVCLSLSVQLVCSRLQLCVLSSGLQAKQVKLVQTKQKKKKRNTCLICKTAEVWASVGITFAYAPILKRSKVYLFLIPSTSCKSAFISGISRTSIKVSTQKKAQNSSCMVHKSFVYFNNCKSDLKNVE